MSIKLGNYILSTNSDNVLITWIHTHVTMTIYQFVDSDTVLHDVGITRFPFKRIINEWIVSSAKHIPYDYIW